MAPHASRLGGSLPQPDAEGHDENPSQSGGDRPPSSPAAGGAAGSGAGLRSGAALVLQARAAPLLAANPPPAGRLPAAPRCMGPFPQRALQWL